jgi:magnesium transporter
MQVLDHIDEQAIDGLLERDEFFWLDLTGPADAEVEGLAKRFDWHPLATEDLIHYGQRPKIDRYGDYMLLVFYGARSPEAAEDGPSLTEAHLIVSGSYIVSIRQTDCGELEELRKRFEARPEKSEQFVVYSVLDTLTDTFFPVLSLIDDAIDQLEDDIVLKPTDEQLQRIFHLKRSLVAMRRIITPQRDLAARTLDEIADLPGLDAEATNYFRDVYDHLIRVSDLIDSYRDLLTGAMDVYLSTVSNRLNVVMKQLTVVATIFLPITALTGFFGQNFGWLVGKIDGLTTFLIYGVGGLVASVIALLIWFRRSGFLD